MMREYFIWNVRLDRNYSYACRLLTKTDELAEAMPYAEAWCTEQGTNENKKLKVSYVECEGSILVPDGLELGASDA